MASAFRGCVQRRIADGNFVLTVELVIFLTVLTDLVIRQSCRLLNMTLENCTRADNVDVEVHRLSSTFIMWKIILGTASPSVILLFVGPWSNVNGRKPVMIVSVFGEMVSQAILMVLSTIENIHPYWLLTSQGPALLTGGFATAVLAAYAYVIDISLPERRSFRMALLSTTITISTVVANLTVTPLQKLGYTAFYGITTAVNFINVLYIIFLLPESVKVNKEKKTSAINLDHLRLSCKTYFKNRPNHSRGIIFSLSVAVCLLIAASSGEDGVTFLSTMKKFEWGIAEYSTFNIVTSVFQAVGIVGTVYVGDTLLKINEIALVITTFTLTMVGSFLIPVIPTPTAFYVFTQLKCTVGCVPSLTKGYIAKIIPESDVVNVINMMGSLELVQPIIGALLYTRVYNAVVGYDPFAIFYLAGGSFAGCLIFAVLGLIMHLIDKKHPSTANVNEKGLEEYQTDEDLLTAMDTVFQMNTS